MNDPLDAYGDAWLETDDDRRLEHLRTAWADGAVYCDPLTRVEGREALSAHIAATRTGLPGSRIAISGTPVRQHDSAFFRWTMTDADGAVLMTGFDVVTLDDDGRIARLNGFFDTDTGPGTA